MFAKIVFLAATVAAAATVAVLCGLAAAIAGLAVHMHADELITVTAATSTAAFIAVTTIAAVAATVFFGPKNTCGQCVPGISTGSCDQGSPAPQSPGAPPGHDCPQDRRCQLLLRLLH